MRTHRIAVLPGDGIGPEVMAAARKVLEALAPTHELRFEFLHAEIGFGTYEATGTALPDATLDVARSADAVLHGATESGSIPPGIRAPLSGLRVELGTYAGIRPALSHPGVAGLHSDVDVVVVRELTEGGYSKVEYMMGPDTACSVRVISRAGAERVGRRAFELAARRRKHLTLTHKMAGLPMGDRFWVDTISGLAQDYPDVRLDARNVDAVAMDLVRDPAAFDVVLCENQNGDIMSDITAGLVGGLGLAASACLGDRWAYFEPVHGSAPDIAGKNLANPMAMILSAALMLDHLGEADAATKVRGAVDAVLTEGVALTGDLGGEASTDQVTQAIIEQLDA